MEAAEFKNDAVPNETHAFALTVFSLVPYLGILFSIPALTVTVASVLDRKRNSKTTRTFSVCLVAGCVILGIQLFLWALLYLAPALV